MRSSYPSVLSRLPRLSRLALLTLAVLGSVAAASAAPDSPPAPAPPAAAAAEKKPAWTGSAEFSYVLTSGNASSQTLGFSGTLTRNWRRNTLTTQASGVRTRASVAERTAVGTPDDFTLVDTRSERLAAENYRASSNFDHAVDGGILLQSGLSWERNRFAGLDSRWVLSAGVGYAFVDNARTGLKAGGSLTVTRRRYAGAPSTGFSGLRTTARFRQKINSAAEFIVDGTADSNLNRLSDWQADATSSLAASITKRLAMKTSVRWMYINRPALAGVPLFAPDGVPTGTTVMVPLKKLDTFFTTSLVLSF